MARLLTKEEVCERLNVPPGTLRRIRENRELQHYKIGGCVRFDSDDVEDYIKSKRVAQRAPIYTIPQPQQLPAQRGPGRPRKTTHTGYVPGMKVV